MCSSRRMAFFRACLNSSLRCPAAILLFGSILECHILNSCLRGFALRDQLILYPYLLLDLGADLRIILQELLRVLTALSDPLAVIGIPRAALVHHGAFGSQIQDLSLSGDACTEHNIKLSLLQRRGNFILHNLHLRVAAHDLAPLLEGLALPYIQSHGRIELQRAAAGGSLRITEHHA